MKRRAGAAFMVLATGVVLALIALPGAGLATRHANPSAAQIKKAKAKAVKKTIKAVKKETVGSADPGLAPADSEPDIKVSSCKQRSAKRAFSGFTCSWAAHGELPGIVPFRCNGQAITDTKGAVKSIDPCHNLNPDLVPLLADPHPVDFGYFETFDVFNDLYDELGASGADIAKQGINWYSLQASERLASNAWDWSTSDAIYRRLTEIGVKPVWTFMAAPCWAAPPSNNCDPSGTHPVAPSHLDDYANAAAEIAKRYPDSAAIEVWLEPNDAQFWGATADPDVFSHLVGATVAKVASTGTGVPVISGGLAPGDASPTKLEMGKFLSQALAAGGIQDASSIGYHAVADVPYKPGSDPTDGYLGRIRINISELEDALKEAGASNPIAVTELAFSSAKGFYSEAQQADALGSSYQMLRRISGMPLILVSKLLDTGDGTKVQGFGVLEPNRSPKPAYCQLAAARGVANPSGC